MDDIMAEYHDTRHSITASIQKIIKRLTPVLIIVLIMVNKLTILCDQELHTGLKH